MISKKQCDLFGLEGVVPGSAEDIAVRQKQKELASNEVLINSVSEDYPSLKRIYEMLKNGGND